jgi:hypothetical protein
VKSVVLVVAVAAAIRSTWSPCGLSMLSTITPIAERGRNHRYYSTATWFVLGAVLAVAISADGSTILGHKTPGYRWTAGSGFQPLPVVPLSLMDIAVPEWISSDGATVLARSHADAETEEKEPEARPGREQSDHRFFPW